jgi:hypothetical protein
MKMEKAQPKYWRIRMKFDTDDVSGEAWQRNEVGIWYGAWTAEDWESAKSKMPNNLCAYLSKVPAQEALGFEIKNSWRQTVKRFNSISEMDWVVIFLRANQEIGLARVCSPMKSAPSHPLNKAGQTFKYREICDKKTFTLTDLPDVYNLLPMQGRGNVNEFTKLWDAVKLLAESSDEEEVKRTLREKPFSEALDLLGPFGWESFCFAYLILEERFVPTGLSVGRTMPRIDIVGRRIDDGTRIYAQCKKDLHPVAIDQDFQCLCNTLDPMDRAYYFAYGGVTGTVPEGVRVMKKENMLAWCQRDIGNGRIYRKLLLEEEM